MLIGAHVSTAGGLPNVVERGLERECEAVQIFHQSSRMWRPTNHSDADVSAFRAAMEDSPIGAVVIHAVYLINCASLESEIREKSLIALKGADEAFKTKVFKNMSQRAAEMMKDDLANKGPVRLLDVEMAQKEILLAARKLADEGTIALGGKGGDEYV